MDKELKMKRSMWAMSRATASGLGLALGRVIVEVFFESHSFNSALLYITMAFGTGFIILLPFWYMRFPGNKNETEK